MIHSITIVIPVFNEENTLLPLHDALSLVLDGLECQARVLFVDDGSTDSSFSLLSSLQARDERVSILRLSRNFGKEAAMTAGLDHATGDAVVVMDADLQDPIDLIPQLLSKLSEGFDVVYARRRSRQGDSLQRRLAAWIFYRLLSRASDIEIPTDVGDFRVMSGKVVEALKALPERQRYVKGIFDWVGFQQTFVDLARPPRAVGETSWPTLRLISHAVDGITSFSRTPLRLATYFGFLVALAAFCYGTWIVLKTLLFGDPVAGFPTLITVILFLGGVQLISIGILGEYVGRNYLESKQRPQYLIDDAIGFDAEKNQ